MELRYILLYTHADVLLVYQYGRYVKDFSHWRTKEGRTGKGFPKRAYIPYCSYYTYVNTGLKYLVPSTGITGWLEWTDDRNDRLTGMAGWPDNLMTVMAGRPDNRNDQNDRTTGIAVMTGMNGMAGMTGMTGITGMTKIMRITEMTWIIGWQGGHLYSCSPVIKYLAVSIE